MSSYEHEEGRSDEEFEFTDDASEQEKEAIQERAPELEDEDNIVSVDEFFDAR
jgi:hypothetical protein